MLKNFGLLCLLMSNATNFSMSRQLASRLPKTIQSYMPSSLTQTPKTGQQTTSIVQETTSISSQGLSKRVNDIFKQQQQYAQTFKNHPAYQEFESLKLSAALQTDFILQQKIMLLHEILQYCQQHPEETEDIMAFYTNMKNADSMIKEKLAQQPEHFQRFFNQQLQQYMQEPYHYSRTSGSTWLKEKILRIFNRPLVELEIAIGVCWSAIIATITIIILLERDPLNNQEYLKEQLDDFLLKNNLFDIENQDLLDTINLLKEALDILNIPFKQSKTNKIANHELHATAYYENTGFNIIVLNPDFFTFSSAAQIYILLHEMRHGLQFNKKVELSPEILEYAKSCKLNLGLNHPVLSKLANTWPRALLEFDADNFAYEHLKNSPNLQKIANERGFRQFDPNKGYFSIEMALKKAPNNAKIKKSFMDELTNFINEIIEYSASPRHAQKSTKNNTENPYLQHIPEHLKQAAAKNKAARLQLLAQKQNPTLFATYLETLKKDDLLP